MGPAKLCKPLRDIEHSFYVLLFGLVETSEAVVAAFGPKARIATEARKNSSKQVSHDLLQVPFEYVSFIQVDSSH